MPQGILNQSSRSSPKDVERIIYNLNPPLHSDLNAKKMHFEYVTRIFAQARITELEEEVSYFIDKFNREKD